MKTSCCISVVILHLKANLGVPLGMKDLYKEPTPQLLSGNSTAQISAQIFGYPLKEMSFMFGRCPVRFTNVGWRPQQRQGQTCAHFLKQIWRLLKAFVAGIINITGVPNDGFLLDTLKTLFRLSTVRFNRPLEMHPKRCYKICTCSVILGELESPWNYKGFIIIFPKILDAI